MSHVKDKDLQILDYLPDEYSEKINSISREYFLGVLGTINERLLKELIDKCLKERFETKANDSHQAGILVNSEWAEQLLKHPFRSSKLV